MAAWPEVLEALLGTDPPVGSTSLETYCLISLFCWGFVSIGLSNLSFFFKAWDIHRLSESIRGRTSLEV